MNLFAYRALALLAVVAALFASGWWYGSAHSDRAWQARIAAQERAALDLAHRQAGRIAAIDAERTESLRGKQREIDRLRAAVAAGAVRLRVAARCPVSAARCPVSAASGPGVGDGAAGGSPAAAGPTGDAYLSRDAEPAYFALRNGIAVQREQLMACQSILSEVSM